MFACHLQVSTPLHVLHLCVCIHVSCILLCNLKTGEPSLRKLPAFAIHQPSPKHLLLGCAGSTYLLQAPSDICGGVWGTAQALALRVGGPGDETVFQA